MCVCVPESIREDKKKEKNKMETEQEFECISDKERASFKERLRVRVCLLCFCTYGSKRTENKDNTI